MLTQVEVVATDQQTLDKAVKNLRVLFSQLVSICDIPFWYYHVLGSWIYSLVHQVSNRTIMVLLPN